VVAERASPLALRDDRSPARKPPVAVAGTGLGAASGGGSHSSDLGGRTAWHPTRCRLRKGSPRTWRLPAVTWGLRSAAVLW